MSSNGRVRIMVMGGIAAIAGALWTGGGAAAADAPPATTASTFTSSTTPAEPSTPGCLPAALAIEQAGVVSTAETFQVSVRVTSNLCEPLTVGAAIYAMPPAADGEWPQALASRTDVVLSAAGTTTFTFHKGCSNDQFDLIVGATPAVISTGFDHGPLLFPADLSTAQQWRGGTCAPKPTTTLPVATTTTSTSVAAKATTTTAPTVAQAAASRAAVTTSTSTPVAVASKARSADPTPVTKLAFTGPSASTPGLLVAAAAAMALGAGLLVVRRGATGGGKSRPRR